MTLTTGIHPDVPMEVYHSDCCEGPSISASGLITIETKSPAHYRYGERDTPALTFGRLAHMLLLEGVEAIEQRYAVKPDGMSLATKDGKAWREAVAAGREIVSWESWTQAVQMFKAIQAHPLALRAFTDGRPEMTLVWQDPATGIYLKARPDWLPHPGNVVPNYKTTVSAKPDVWAKQAFSLGYHQAAALCLDGLNALLPERAPWHYFWVAQEKEPPYVVEIMTMKEEAIAWGRLLNRRAIETFARCVERNTWPGYTDGAVTEIDMPAWVERGLDARHEAGEFTEAA